MRLFTLEIIFLNESIHAWIEAKDKFRENLTFRKKVLSYKKCSLMELELKLVMTKKKKKNPYVLPGGSRNFILNLVFLFYVEIIFTRKIFY